MKMEKTDKKQAILDAAGKLFCELGFEGTSTRLIAKESNSNMAMINYYFGSKEGVFLEIMTERICGFQSELKIINADQISPIEKLHKVIEGYVGKILTNVPFHKMMIRELSLTQRPEMYEQVLQAVSKNKLYIEQILIEGIEKKHFREVDVKLTLASIMGTVTNVVLAPFRDANGVVINLDDPKEKAALRARLINHLKDLTIVYLKPSK